MKKLAVVSAAATIVVALLVVLTPHWLAPPCRGLMELKSGMMAHMTCYWTGQAAMVLGILALLTGILYAVNRTAETRRALGFIQAALAIALILISKDFVIGICTHEMMACHRMVAMLNIMAVVLFVLGIISIFFPGAYRIKTQSGKPFSRKHSFDLGA